MFDVTSKYKIHEMCEKMLIIVYGHCLIFLAGIRPKDIWKNCRSPFDIKISFWLLYNQMDVCQSCRERSWDAEICSWSV